MKNKIYLIFALFLIFTILSGCKTLTKSQIKACNKYFVAMKEYNQYAIELNRHTASIKLKRQKLLASTFDSIPQIVVLLDTAIITYQHEIIMPYDLHKSIIQINSYISGYSFKTYFNPNFLRNLKSFMITYIPVVGGLVYEVLYTTRNLLIKPYFLYRDGKKIRYYISSGNEIIANNSTVIQKYSGIYHEDLKEEDSLLKEHFILFVENLHKTPDSEKKYSDLNPIFIRQFSELSFSKQMGEHMSLASDYLYSTHDTLYKLTRKRKRIKGGIPELSNLVIETSYLKKISNELKKFE